MTIIQDLRNKKKCNFLKIFASLRDLEQTNSKGRVIISEYWRGDYLKSWILVETLRNRSCDLDTIKCFLVHFSDIKYMLLWYFLHVVISCDTN